MNIEELCKNFESGFGQLIQTLSTVRNEVFLFKDTKGVDEDIKGAIIWMNELTDILNKTIEIVNKEKEV